MPLVYVELVSTVSVNAETVIVFYVSSIQVTYVSGMTGAELMVAPIHASDHVTVNENDSVLVDRF